MGFFLSFMTAKALKNRPWMTAKALKNQRFWQKTACNPNNYENLIWIWRHTDGGKAFFKNQPIRWADFLPQSAQAGSRRRREALFCWCFCFRKIKISGFKKAGSVIDKCKKRPQSKAVRRQLDWKGRLTASGVPRRQAGVGPRWRQATFSDIFDEIFSWTVKL